MPGIGGFAVFLQKKAAALRKKGKKVNFRTFSQKCGKKWRRMPRYIQEKYNRRARSRSHSCRRLKKRRRLFDSRRRPKKPMSAYAVFVRRRYRSVANAYPQTSARGIIAILGRMWRCMTETGKAPYYKAAKNDYKRYQKAIAAMR